MKNAFFNESNPGGLEVIPRFLSPLLICVIIKHVTLVIVSVIIRTNALFINAPLAPDGRPVITPTAAPFANTLSRIPLQILPQPPCDGHQDLLVDPQFPRLPLIALTHRIPGLIARITGTARQFLIKTISMSMRISLAMESSTASVGATSQGPRADPNLGTFKAFIVVSGLV